MKKFALSENWHLKINNTKNKFQVKYSNLWFEAIFVIVELKLIKPQKLK